MEMENKFASNGKGNLGVTLGAVGLGAALLGGNGVGNILGGGNCYSKYDAEKDARIAELETEVKLRDANTYTDGKILEMYKYFDGKVAAIEGQICQQNVYNATNTAALGCIQGQVAQLMSLTKVVVPNSSVCPGWGSATVTVTPSTTTG